LVGLVVAVFSIGLAIGSMRAKFIAKEKCETMQKECYNLRNQQINTTNAHIEKAETNFMIALEKVNVNLNNSLIRVHLRLDQLLRERGIYHNDVLEK
jgi:hypothetical protein